MPAPFWFVEFFKVVGFVLHTIPMGIWFAGIPVALFCALLNTPNSCRYAERMFKQFPIMLALGINFGIVPLLFLQTTYYKPFYTATILMAWHWIAIIPILIVGYYSVYLAAFSAGVPAKRKTNLAGTPAPRNWRLIGFGALASLCLITIGILMTNGLTLMVRSDLWPGIMEKTNYFGATTGLANNMHDPAVWIRLATMFSLGLITTGVWTVFDSHFLQNSQEPGAVPPDYRRWTLRLAAGTIVVGFLATLVITSPNDLRYFGNAHIDYATKIAIFTACLAVSAAFAKEKTSIYVIGMVVAHIVTLAGFGIMRQIGQNAGVKPVVDVANLPTDVQWTPLLAFLVVFVLGLVCIGWMVRQLMLCENGHNTAENAQNTVPSPSGRGLG